MTITHTYTKTYALMDAWASTTPRNRRNCADPCPAVHVHAWDVCAVPQCDKRLLPDEECYSVLQVQTTPDEAGEKWVCWRHVRPDDGPIRITREVTV